MPPLTVVEDLDVLSDGRLGLGAGQIAAMVNEFVFQAAPEALHRSVVVAISPAEHRGRHEATLYMLASHLNCLLELMASADF